MDRRDARGALLRVRRVRPPLVHDDMERDLRGDLPRRGGSSRPGLALLREVANLRIRRGRASLPRLDVRPCGMGRVWTLHPRAVRRPLVRHAARWCPRLDEPLRLFLRSAPRRPRASPSGLDPRPAADFAALPGSPPRNGRQERRQRDRGLVCVHTPGRLAFREVREVVPLGRALRRVAFLRERLHRRREPDGGRREANPLHVRQAPSRDVAHDRIRIAHEDVRRGGGHRARAAFRLFDWCIRRDPRFIRRAAPRRIRRGRIPRGADTLHVAVMGRQAWNPEPHRLARGAHPRVDDERKRNRRLRRRLRGSTEHIAHCAGRERAPCSRI